MSVAYSDSRANATVEPGGRGSMGMRVANSNPPAPPPEPSRPPALDRLGQTLRDAFDDAAAEPLPQAFEELLRRLR
ncbi:NepR family anti-sigma factor [Glacieibacterium frigidum]|uniref:NepR family anti-sigma factor n=1 Tax=Glacieibacterium frigidum TaxID=2593303 RepID=UPI00163DBEC5|nr:NepR family anti-sigma factor [Glacieibacterium frigidum]